MTLDRTTALKSVRRVVIKLGTAVLTRDDGRLDRALIASLAEQVGGLRRRRIEVIVVSSGAVGAGMAEMALSDRPRDVADTQALAAIGQGQLMRIYSDAFAGEQLHVAQILLSRSDLDDRQRYLNARNALHHLLDLGVVPIVNENDTTAIDELTFGDNDILSAIVAAKVDAQMLIILTVVDGLHGADGAVVPHVERVTDEVMALVQRDRSPLGRGGMESKLVAARSATTGGVITLIASGKHQHVIDRVFSGEPIGTWFSPSERGLTGRKRWIAMGKAHHDHFVSVDAGAVRALVDGGKSLLPIGIVEVGGDFERGDLVEIRDPEGRTVGRGLVNYPSDQIESIRGLATADIEKHLGAAPHAEVIHRDNLIVYH